MRRTSSREYKYAWVYDCRGVKGYVGTIDTCAGGQGYKATRYGDTRARGTGVRGYKATRYEDTRARGYGGTGVRALLINVQLRGDAPLSNVTVSILIGVKPNAVLLFR